MSLLLASGLCGLISGTSFHPGLFLAGASADDVEQLEAMLRTAMADSPTMSTILADIASEADAANAIHLTVGRNLPGVVVDSFARNLVDLEDLQRFPSARDPTLERDEITREELLVHVLAERRHFKKMGARRGRAAPPADVMWRAAHEVGLLAENAHRAERGQTPVASATSHAIAGAPGLTLIEYTLADSTVSYVVTTEHGRIQRIVPPSAPRVAAR